MPFQLPTVWSLLWVELCSPQKFICWTPNSQDLRMWLYLEIGSSQNMEENGIFMVPHGGPIDRERSARCRAPKPARTTHAVWRYCTAVLACIGKWPQLLLCGWEEKQLDCSEHVTLNRSLVLSSLTEFFRKMSGRAESCLLSYTDSTRMFIICSFRTFTKYTLDTLLDVLINVFSVVQGI